MLKNPLLIVALALTGAVAVWGMVDTETYWQLVDFLGVQN